MAEQKKIQLYTDRACTVEASPETMAKNVTLSDGLDVESVLKHDLTAPTVVHEETSFKIGVGDIDVSSSVVDGEPSKVVIKGKTYQNILPEPSLRNSMTNGKSMQKLNEGYENVNVVDGVAKSAILKGNTLVNLNNGQRNETLDSTIGDGSSRTYACKIPYTIPSGTYITFKLKTNTINGITGNLKAHFKQNAATTTTGDRYPTLRNYNSHPTGEYYINVCHQTPIDLEAINLYIDDNVGVIDVSDVMILIGDYTNVDIPYFEGMQSVRMPVLTTVGKNLFNKDEPLSNYYVGADGNKTTTDDYVYVNQNYFTGDNKSISISYSSIVNTQYGDPYVRISEYDKNSNFIKRTLVLTKNTSFNFDSNTHYINICTDNSAINERYFVDLQIEFSSTVTSYEPYKSNILSTPEDLELRGIGEVKDTLNLNTGEYVQRIKEMVLNGSENYTVVEYIHNNTNLRFDLYINEIKSTTYSELLCDSLPVLTDSMLPEGENTKSYIASHANGGRIVIIIEKSKLPSENIEGFKTWLQANPITVQYKLTTPIVKTVDLSSSGNWEKIVLNGSENWQSSDPSKDKTHRFVLSSLTNRQHGVENLICDKVVVKNTYNTDEEGILGSAGGTQIYLRILKSKLVTQDVNGLKQYLQQNPITVWYQTTTHQDSTQVKQPIFFKDGHIQLSSGVDNSLIPTLDYQAKTRNSYVMDLMKSGTWYTMKAKSASGTLAFASNTQPLSTNGKFAVDGASFQNANKLMVINGSVEDLMILEGDLTPKTIPYFKGIKSAFEDESKIEVLSTGKNLFNVDKYASDNDIPKVGKNGLYINRISKNLGVMDIPYKKKTQYVIGYQSYELVTTNNDWTPIIQFNYSDGTYEQLYLHQGNKKISNVNKDVVGIILNNPWTNVTANVYGIYVEEFANNTEYEPYKSNVSKIPLLSPLRSLPNGVYDELIIDRMKKKATIVQRVGCGTLGQQGHGYNVANSTIDTSLYQPWYTHDLGGLVANVQANQTTMWSDKFLVETTHYVSKKGNSIHQYSDDSANFVGCILKSTLGAKTVQQWFEANNVTVYYQLKTPIVTEVDLDKYPFIYNDGHIFLNSEIAPVVEISYNVNQTQQIQANNETLQRHELDIDNLDSLIAGFIHADYQLRLFQFDYDMATMSARKGK